MDDKVVINEQIVGIAGNKNFLPYYTNVPWSKDESYFVFFSSALDGHDLSLWRFFPAISRTEKITYLQLWQGVDSLQQEEEMLGGVFLPRKQLMLIPRGNTLIRVDLTEENCRTVFAGDGDVKVGGPICASADERYVCAGVYPRLSALTRPPASSEVVVLDTEPSDSQASWTIAHRSRINFWADHFQFFSNGEDILFAHEGTAETVSDRLNVLNWPTGKHRCIYQQQHNASGQLIEYVGHERMAGNKVVAVRYPTSLIDFGLLVVDPATESGRLVVRDDCWHCSANAAGDLLVMDTMWWGRSSRRQEFVTDILLYNCRNGKKTFLKTVPCNAKRQIHHSHPQLNAAGDRVLVITRDGIAPDSAAGFILLLELELQHSPAQSVSGSLPFRDP